MAAPFSGSPAGGSWELPLEPLLLRELALLAPRGEAGAVWALTHLPTAAFPCQAPGKGDFRPVWAIGLLGGLGSLDLLWGNVELEQDAGGVCRMECVSVLCCAEMDVGSVG